VNPFPSGRRQDESVDPLEVICMIRRLVSIIVVVFYFLLFSFFVANSQDLGVVDEATAGNFFGVGARAMGMGGAHIAVACDATALVYNPAGLARVKRIEFSGGLTHQRLRNRTGDLTSVGIQSSGIYFNDGRLQSNTRLSSANIVLPVPTYRGSLVFALGVNRVKSFDKVMKFSWKGEGELPEGIESESGGIYLWSFGGAIDISPNVSVGGAFNFWSGTDNYSWLYEAYYSNLDTLYRYKYDDTIKDRYSGFNLKLGVRVQPNRFLIVGGVIESPVTYTIREDWTQTTDIEFYQPSVGTDHDYDSDSPEYKISLPFSLGIGIALNFNNLLLAGDLNYTDWTQMEYKRLWDMAEANRTIKDSYTDVLRWNVGAEYLFPQIGTRLRAGYYQNPLPYKSTWIKKNRNYFTFGVGFLIDQVMTVDLAWVHGSWELNDFDMELAEKYTTNQIFFTTAYHF
jgi:long-subunit fatty acid transport protein